MKKIIGIIAIAIFVSCNNNGDNKNNNDTLKPTGSDVSNAAPMQGDTSSYERMSNKIDSSHHH